MLAEAESIPSVWVPDRGWALLSTATDKKCRYTVSHRKTCKCKAVALFMRPGKKCRWWWAYCEQHLFGREIINGQVCCQVAADSKAAKQGFAG